MHSQDVLIDSMIASSESPTREMGKRSLRDSSVGTIPNSIGGVALEASWREPYGKDIDCVLSDSPYGLCRDANELIVPLTDSS